MKHFKANGLPLLIGSLPLDNHEEAVKLVLEHTPDIPLWVQLPCFPEEGMIPQFLEGFPGFAADSGKNIVNTSAARFDEEMLSFFEDYLSCSETDTDLSTSRFALTGSRAKGFNEFLRQIDTRKENVAALKGQVTGPITFCTGVKDQDNKDIFYNEQLKDVAVKTLALNARWQAKEFRKRGALPIIFIDEPVLAGFGTSAYITITKEDVTHSIDEIVQEIHSEDGLAGVHVCANTQWDMLLNAAIDVISFDAFSYFDKFILYPDEIKTFLGHGKILAWGIVPTLKPEVIARQTSAGLTQLLDNQMNELSQKTGIDKKTILSRSFVTPSCGTGPLTRELAESVLKMTREVSEQLRMNN